MTSFEYKWVIENFAELCTDQISDKLYLYSQRFQPTSNQNYEFYLSLDPKFQNSDKKNEVPLFLFVSKGPTSEVLINVKYCFLDSNGHTFKKKGISHFSTQICLLIYFFYWLSFTTHI